MSIVRKRAVPAARGPVKILKVTEVVQTTKAMFHVHDLLDAVRTLGYVFDDRKAEELLGKRTAGVAADLKQVAVNLAQVLRTITVEEAESIVQAVASKSQKGRGQPGARVVSATSAVQAIGLRSALGLKTSPAQAESEARRMTDVRQRAATKVEGSQDGRAVDVPFAAAPTFVDNSAPTTVEYLLGARLPQEAALSVVYMKVNELFIANDRRPITLSASELARATGLTAEQANAAIVELEKRKLLTRQPGRAFSTPLWAPASL